MYLFVPIICSLPESNCALSWLPLYQNTITFALLFCFLLLIVTLCRLLGPGLYGKQTREKPCRNLWELLVYSACSGKVLYKPECTLESTDCFKKCKTFGMCQILFFLLRQASVEWSGIVVAHSTRHPLPAVNILNDLYFAVDLWSRDIFTVLLQILYSCLQIYHRFITVIYRYLRLFTVPNDRVMEISRYITEI